MFQRLPTELQERVVLTRLDNPKACLDTQGELGNSEVALSLSHFYGVIIIIIVVINVMMTEVRMTWRGMVRTVVKKVLNIALLLIL